MFNTRERNENKREKEKERSVGVETLLHRPAAADGANDGGEAEAAAGGANDGGESAAAACTEGTVLRHTNANTAKHARRVICSLRFIIVMLRLLGQQSI